MPVGLYTEVQELFGQELFAAISFSGSGDNTVVAGTPGKQIRVLRSSVVVAGATVLTWKSSVSGAISGPLSFISNTGIADPYCPKGLFQCVAGESLVLNSSQSVSVGGYITYLLV